jgi:exodeoxyribonuclease VII large subunit
LQNLQSKFFKNRKSGKMPGVYTVAQINSYIKNMFRQDFVLNRISVKGEISNCKYHTSGHIYFTLKDADGVMSAIMFAGSATGLDFRLENGMNVVVHGRIDVYERDGKYQLYASAVELQGQGDLYRKFEELKQTYEEMGYFSAQYKQKIPAFAKKVGIVTASTGAAIHDIMNIAYRRNPYVSLVLYPALVQGDSAPASIERGIKTLDEYGLDVIIIGRGGGSIEDLWAFNDELVIEAVFAAKTPIISAVGHETDFTIADFVADLRAPTPSAAAELAVCDISAVESYISDLQTRLNDRMQDKIFYLRGQLEKLSLQMKFLNPVVKSEEKRQRLIALETSLVQEFTHLVENKKHQLQMYATRLEGVSPLGRLSQGYSYVEHDDGRRITCIEDIKVKDKMKVYFKDGIVTAEALEVINGKGTDT